MGYVERIACRTAFAEDLIAFAIFLVVHLLLQEVLSFLKGLHRSGTCQSRTKSGFCIVSGIAIRPCRTRSCFSNTGIASYNTTFHQRVSIVSIGESGLTCVAEMSPSCMTFIR